MTMTWNDVVELLALAAVYDQRRGDELDVKAWLLVAEDHRWLPAVAQRVVREHYGSGADRPRITPAAITDRIRALRARAAASFEPPVIPAELPVHDYPAWLRAQLSAHVDELLSRWATTGEEPPLAAALPRARAAPAELAAAAPDHLRPAIQRGLAQLGRGPSAAREPSRRAESRAELDTTRPADQPTSTSQLPKEPPRT